MITPDWNKNLKKERLPLVSSSQALAAFAESWDPRCLQGLRNHPAFHKICWFFWGRFGQDLDKHYAEYALSCFHLRWESLRGRRGIPATYRFSKSLSPVPPNFIFQAHFYNNDDGIVHVFAYRETYVVFYVEAVDVAGCDNSDVFGIYN